MHDRRYNSRIKRSKNKGYYKRIVTNRGGSMSKLWKSITKDMLKPFDGKKINWWINGFFIVILIVAILGVIANG